MDGDTKSRAILFILDVYWMKISAVCPSAVELLSYYNDRKLSEGCLNSLTYLEIDLATILTPFAC